MESLSTLRGFLGFLDSVNVEFCIVARQVLIEDFGDWQIISRNCLPSFQEIHE